jgi:hypothetical protein
MRRGAGTLACRDRTPAVAWRWFLAPERFPKGPPVDLADTSERSSPKSRCTNADSATGYPDKAYRQTKSPQERMEALKLLRQIVYGYDPATTRLQRVLEVAELE